MKTQSFLITTEHEPPSYRPFFFYYDCAKCARSTLLTCEPAKDGIGLSISIAASSQRKSSPHKLCWVQTVGGKVSISCGYCHSGASVLQISRVRDGTSCLPESLSAEKCTHNPNTCNVGFCEFPKCNFKSFDDMNPVKPVHFCGGNCPFFLERRHNEKR